MNFLLPAQTLLDLCDQQPNAARAWAAGVDTAALRVSVISIAEARSAIDGVLVGVDLPHASLQGERGS